MLMESSGMESKCLVLNLDSFTMSLWLWDTLPFFVPHLTDLVSGDVNMTDIHIL